MRKYEVKLQGPGGRFDQRLSLEVIPAATDLIVMHGSRLGYFQSEKRTLVYYDDGSLAEVILYGKQFFPREHEVIS